MAQARDQRNKQNSDADSENQDLTKEQPETGIQEQWTQDHVDDELDADEYAKQLERSASRKFWFGAAVFVLLVSLLIIWQWGLSTSKDKGSDEPTAGSEEQYTKRPSPIIAEACAIEKKACDCNKNLLSGRPCITEVTAMLGRLEGRTGLGTRWQKEQFEGCVAQAQFCLMMLRNRVKSHERLIAPPRPGSTGSPRR